MRWFGVRDGAEFLGRGAGEGLFEWRQTRGNWWNRWAGRTRCEQHKFFKACRFPIYLIISRNIGHKGPLRFVFGGLAFLEWARAGLGGKRVKRPPRYKGGG